VPPTVRRARASDLDAFVAGTLGNALESEGLRLDPAVVRPAVERLLRDPTCGLAWVAEDQGRVVGSTYVTPEWSDWHGGWYWWIQSLFVAADRRGTGVVDALLGEVRKAARDAGDVRKVRLYVERDNARAIAAYRRLGFKDTPYLVQETDV
jgi:ribosomal protein S18 acetylase RimI-like enzyme